MLLNGTSYRGESIIGIRADQTDGTNDQYQDHGEHHRVFGDILPAVVSQNLGEDTHFSAIPFNRETSDFRLEMPTLRKTERGWVRHQNSSPNFTVAIVRPRPRRVNRMGGCAKLGSGSDIQQISTLAMLAFGAVRIRVQLTVAENKR